MFVTLDGYMEVHDSLRHLKSGENTYSKIIDNSYRGVIPNDKKIWLHVHEI